MTYGTMIASSIPRYKGGKSGSLFRYETPEAWGGAPISINAGDVALRVFDRETRKPVGAGVNVSFYARGAEWSYSTTTDEEGFAYAEDAPNVPIEAKVEYGSNPVVLLHPSLTFTGRFKPVMAGGRIPSMVSIKGFSVGAIRKIRVEDRFTNRPVRSARVIFFDRKGSWSSKTSTDSEGYASADAPDGAHVTAIVEYKGRRWYRNLPTFTPARGHEVQVGRSMHVEGRYIGITPEAADLYPLVNGHEKATMGITPEAADLFPLIEDRREIRVGAIDRGTMIGRIYGIGQGGGSYIRLGVIDVLGNPIAGVKIVVQAGGTMTSNGVTDSRGEATIHVPGKSEGADVLAIVLLPEYETSNAPAFTFRTVRADAPIVILRSSSRGGTPIVKWGEVAALGLGAIGTMVAIAEVLSDSPAFTVPLAAVSGSLFASGAFSALSRNL